MVRISALSLVLILCSACTTQVRTTSIGVALTDGTHTGGGLIAVDSDWLVLGEYNTSPLESPLTLIDYTLIDTIKIIGAKYDRAGAVLGGLVGAITGIFASGALDSASPSQERTRFALGLGIGLVSGAGLGYLIGSHFADNDSVIAHPVDTDFISLKPYAVFPDTIPRWLELEIDSIEEQNPE